MGFAVLTVYRVHLVLAGLMAVAGAWQWAETANLAWGFVLVGGLVWAATVVILVDMRELKRRVWEREGKCPGCGYDWRENRERCPECGRAKTGDRSQKTEG